MKRVFVLSVLVVAACFVFAGNVWAKPIKVGFGANLTGPVSGWGQANAHGLEDYLKYVNEVKGGVAGNKFDLRIVDTAYKIPEAVAAAKKFAVSEKVDFYVSWSSGEGLAIKPIIQQYKIPTLNYSVAWELLEPPIDYFFLPVGTHNPDCQGILDYILQIHKGKESPKVGLLTFNNAYGITIHKPSKEFAKAHNIDIVGIEEFSPRAVDLTTEVLRLKKNGADYIVMQSISPGVVAAMKACDKLQYDVPIFGDFGVSDPDFPKLAKGLIKDRFYMATPFHIPGDGTPADKLMDDLINRYKTVEAGTGKADSGYWEGVSVGAIIERACQRAQEKFGKIDRETITAALESFDNEDFGGLIPPVTYSKTDHAGMYQRRIVKVCEDGILKPVTNFFTPGKGDIKLLREK